MPTIASHSDARLRASEACCALYVSRDTTDLTVAEIASAVGISQRSFYRYFPIKAESVSPVLDWTTRTFNEAVQDAPADTPVREVLRDAFRAMLGGAVAERTRTLFPLIFADPEMWSVFLRKVHNGERSLSPVLAPRLGLDPSSLASRASAATVASATRLALELMVTDGADPEERFMQVLDTFSSGAVRTV